MQEFFCISKQFKLQVTWFHFRVHFVVALCNSIVRFYVLGNKNSRMYLRKIASWHERTRPNPPPPRLTFTVSSVLDQS